MSTPPLSSSSSSTNSPSLSPCVTEDLLNAEADNMTFDGQDTLELLLQTITQNMDSPGSGSNNDDWSHMSNWTQSDTKPTELTSDFNFAFPMDLDFDPNMSVDPSALHFNTSMFTQAPVTDNQYLLAHAEDMMAASMFPYAQPTWPQDSDTDHTGARARRLSITSSSSSSGASLSPILEAQSTASSSSGSDCGDYTLNEGDPAFELAQRVCQVAGVTLAVPVSAQVKQLAAASAQAKLPIPRLARSPSSMPSLKRNNSYSASSASERSPSVSPVASSPSDSSDSTTASAGQSPDLDAGVVVGSSGRPKTSHTTIERRYRTNLNARITGLKHAVPALRVLELKNGESSPYDDVVDPRGFVDGVKVARKMSKANILGKATEYIRVLKKREARLKREQDGLRSLIGGLVGGPALLKEWDREWKEQFGSEEKDEIEGKDAAAGSDDEDGDGDDSDAEDEEGRVRKKAKVVKPPKKEKPPKPAPSPPVAAIPGAAPEKRKRGRPRKVPLPATTSPITINPIQDLNFASACPVAPQQNYVVDNPSGSQPAQQYLLAAFAFFSVFNSPLASSFSRTHSHSSPHGDHTYGTVLTAHPSMVPTASSIVVSRAYGLQHLIQAFHLLVSTLVLFYVVFPWLSSAMRRNALASAALQRIRSSFLRKHANTLARPTNPPSSFNDKSYHRVVLMDALSSAARGSTDEPARLRNALGVATGIFGLMQSVIKAARTDRGLEMNQLEQRAWVRLGELVAFDATVSKATRLQTYWCMSWHVSTFTPTTSDLCTLALIVLPVSRSKAAELWKRACHQEILRPYEKIVLSNMTIQDAADWLNKWRRWHDTERKGRCAACEKRTPLGVLAAILTRERLRKHAAAMFVRTVVPNSIREGLSDGYGYGYDEPALEYDPDQEERDDQERKETIEAGKSIGGRTAELATLLERIWDTGFCAHEDVAPAPRSPRAGKDLADIGCIDEHDLARSDEAEIRSLLSATLIYRRIFPSSFPSCATAVSVILSPPPSPSRKNLALHVSLRAALASSAFDYDADRLKDGRLGGALEDARDRVNDMLTALERSLRRNVRC